MIRDTIIPYLKRLSDYILSGRNRHRIVFGTDRKDTVNSGYGDGGSNDVNSSTIDIVVGFEGQNVSFLEDKCRIYISEKTDPDVNAGISIGRRATGEPAILIISDNCYTIARKTVKIVVGQASVVISEDGSIQIEGNSVVAKTPGGAIQLAQSGEVLLGSEAGVPARILTENDIGHVVVPGAGTGTCTFRPPGVVNNQKVKINL